MNEAHEENIKLENLIQQTKDYSKFNFLEANRETGKNHINRLKASIEENPELIAAQPILVNENYDIIDGQHRFFACQELELPIYYMVVKGLGIKQARTMNITHKTWTLKDFTKSYAGPPSNNPHYRKFLQLIEDFEMPVGVLINYVHGKRRPGATSDFRRGRFVIEDYNETVRRLDMLAETGQYVEQVSDQNYANAFLQVMQSENYNHKHMLKKLQLHADRMLKRYANKLDYLRALEDIYNYNITEGNRIRVW